MPKPLTGLRVTVCQSVVRVTVAAWMFSSKASSLRPMPRGLPFWLASPLILKARVSHPDTSMATEEFRGSSKRSWAATPELMSMAGAVVYVILKPAGELKKLLVSYAWVRLTPVPSVKPPLLKPKALGWAPE